MIDFHDGAYADLKRQIDVVIRSAANPAAVEKEKGKILVESAEYLGYLAQSTGASVSEARDAVAELAGDEEFFASIADGLVDLASVQKFEPGELRVHSYSVYAVTRLIRPKIIVETGVANGKSSAFILRALDRVNQGSLISIDLPHVEGEVLQENNCGTILAGRGSGWLVPAGLRSRWTLQLGDARELLPPLVARFPRIDMFFHDSLHTYDHMMFELGLALNWLAKGGVVICDDIRNNSAFAEMADGRTSAAFGTFGTIRA